MCRLFGFHALQEDRVHAALVEESNSLKFQSREHPDGWGIAAYDAAGMPTLTFSLQPAHADGTFDLAASQLYVKTVIAHVRLASVGGVHLGNAHPFRHGRWCFAHNGTVTGFAEAKERLETEIRPDLRARISGDTDSERCFALLLTELARTADLEGPVPVDVLARAVARTSARVAAATDTEDKPSSLNFLVTDGRVMVASRRHRPLHVVSAPGSFLVASEKLCTERPWEEVPNHSVVGADEARKLYRWETGALAG